MFFFKCSDAVHESFIFRLFNGKSDLKMDSACKIFVYGESLALNMECGWHVWWTKWISMVMRMTMSDECRLKIIAKAMKRREKMNNQICFVFTLFDLDNSKEEGTERKKGLNLVRIWYFRHDSQTTSITKKRFIGSNTGAYIQIITHIEETMPIKDSSNPNVKVRQFKESQFLFVSNFQVPLFKTVFVNGSN